MIIRFLAILFFLLAKLAYGQNNVSQKKDAQAMHDNTFNIPPEMYPKDNIIIATHSDFTKKHYPERILEFQKSPLLKNDIVLLGDSITEQGGGWDIRLNNSKVKNRGISGDTTIGVFERLGEVLFCEPQQVFLLIGINDLFVDNISAEVVFSNIINIVNEIQKKSPNTKVFVNTILPTSTEKIKIKIQKTNALLLNEAKKNSFEIISIHDDFATEQDLMNMKFSADGVHLNEIGYQVWVNKINKLIVR